MSNDQHAAISQAARHAIACGKVGIAQDNDWRVRGVRADHATARNNNPHDELQCRARHCRFPCAHVEAPRTRVRIGLAAGFSDKK